MAQMPKLVADFRAVSIILFLFDGVPIPCS